MRRSSSTRSETAWSVELRPDFFVLKARRCQWAWHVRAHQGKPNRAMGFNRYDSIVAPYVGVLEFWSGCFSRTTRPRQVTSEVNGLCPTTKRMSSRVPIGSLFRAANDKLSRLIASVLARRHGSPAPVRNSNGSRRGKRRARVRLVTPRSLGGKDAPFFSNTSAKDKSTTAIASVRPSASQ